MKLQFYYFAVVLFFFKNLCPSNAINDISLVSFGSAISSLLRYTEQNDDDSCGSSSGNITEILEYIKMGEEEIERTDVEDIVIVLGASGVGKSTLVQFVANETNSLRANCSAVECKIIDDSETIGEDIISKTFLPNLVFHNSSNTPFYDMPGFNDNRSPEMEIANGFFMQQIISQAKRIKILILARFTSFTTSARQDFKMLLQNLADLVKSPEKFKGGMGIIATAAMALDEEHQGILDHLSMFLNNDLVPFLNELFVGFEDYYPDRSNITLQNIDPNMHLSYFWSPKKSGPIINEPRMQQNKERMDEVIYKNLKFISTDESDFGLPLSEKAILVLQDVGYCISDTLTKQMNIFAENLKTTIQEGLLNVANGNYEEIDCLGNLVTNVTNLDLSFENPLSIYLEQLLNSISNLQVSSVEDTEEQISSAISVLKFIEQTKATVPFDPYSWVSPINASITSLTAGYIIQSRSVSDELVSNLKLFAAGLKETILEGLSSISEGNDEDVEYISGLLTNLTSTKFGFEKPLSNYLNKLQEAISNLKISISNETMEQISNTATFMGVIERSSVIIPLDPADWVDPITAIIPAIAAESSNITRTVSDALVYQINVFASDVKITILEGLSNLVGGREVDIKNLSELVTNLTSNNYNFDMPLSNYLTQLLKCISNLQVSTLEQTKLQILNAASLMTFMEQTNVTLAFDPIAWVSPITTKITEINVESSEYTTTVSDRIKSDLDQFAVTIEKYFTDKLKLVAGGDSSINKEHLSNILEQMVTADYSFLDETEKVYSFYMESVKKTISSYGESEAETTVNNLEYSETILAILERLVSDVNIYPGLWGSLKTIKSNVEKRVAVEAGVLQDSIYSSLIALSEGFAAVKLDEINILKDISLKVDKSDTIANSINQISIDLLQAESDAIKLSEFITYYQSVVVPLIEDCSNCRSIDELEALKVFEVLSDFGWKSKNWTSSFMAAVLEPIINERDLNIFLNLLFKDLSLPAFQTGEKNGLQKFWESNRAVIEGTFTLFWRHISGDFEASVRFGIVRTQEIIFYKPEGKKRLEALLGLMLEDLYGDCSTSPDLVISGLIVSFDRAMDCVNQTNRSSVTLIATHQMFANAMIIGKEINKATNIKLTVMTNTITVMGGIINLSGNEVVQGEDGGPAGTQYALYKEMIKEGDPIFSSGVAGGKGGTGFKGDTGIEGERGKNLFTVKEDCAAWVGGIIQIRTYKNSCNDGTTGSKPENSSYYCHAGDNGIKIEIYGLEGTKGGTGLQGTPGYSGGSGGQSYSIQADKFKEPKHARNGAQGDPGVGGEGGDGGQGGFRGDTLTMTIDDTNNGGSRSCEQKKDTPTDTNPSRERAPQGSRGQSGPWGNIVKPQKTIKSEDVKPHLELLRSLLTKQADDEFLNLQSKAFLELINTGEPL